MCRFAFHQKHLSPGLIMATELPKSHAVEGINFSYEGGFELRSEGQLGGTDTDQHEMRVLGRIQQLNVRISQLLS
jgi:hypothetical protein